MLRGRKDKKASKSSGVKSPQRQHHPPQPQEAPVPAPAAPTNTTLAAVGTDTRVFPSRHLDVPALYETQVTAENALETLGQIELLNYDDRLLIAEDLRKKLAAFVDEAPSTPLKDTLRTRMQTSPLKEELALLATRGVECREAVEDLSGTENWTLVVRSFGFDTYVRPMGGQMYVKVVGEQEGTSVFDQLVVVREAAMYHRWGPFVCSSALVHSFKDLDLLVSFELNAPLFHRDALLRGYACDYSEKDMVLICGDSTPPSAYPQLNLPAEPNGWMFKRMYLTKFRTQVQLRGVNKGKVILAAIIDPQTALPTSVVNFCLQRIVGVLLYLLLRTAQRLNEAGDKLGAEYLQVVRSDPYYHEHCLPRILWYCQQKGWEYPVAGTMGGDSVLANLAEAVQAVVEEDRRLLPAAAAAAAPPAAAATMMVGGTREVPVMGGDAAPGEKKEKKKKHFLRGLFRRKKHHHKHNHKPTAEDLLQVVGGATASAGGGGGGGGNGGLLHQHGERGAAACPLHGQKPRSPLRVASPQQQRQQQQTGVPGTPATAGEGGEVLSWTLPVVAGTYFLTRVTIAPLVRSFSGPVGEAIVLAVLLQQVLSLLLKKNVLDVASLPSLGGVDLSHAFFAASLGLALVSVVLTTLLNQPPVELKHIQGPGLWERLSLSSNNETVHLVNTGLFLLVLLLIASQPKTRAEVRRLSEAVLSSSKKK